MRILIAGNDPQILVLAYYILKLSTDHDVTVAYTREDNPFKDDVLGLTSPYTERHLSALGCRIEHLNKVNVDLYDLKIDFLEYKIENLEKGDYILGLGPIEIRLSEKLRLPMYPEDTREIDSDVIRYVRRRIETKRRYRPIRVTYGIGHISRPDLRIGYGAISRYFNTATVFKDPSCIYRHCIYLAALLTTKRLENAHNFPAWFNIKFGDLALTKYGPSSEEITERGISPTAIVYTVDDAYVKVISIYKSCPLAFQCVGPSDIVVSKVILLYGIVSSSLTEALVRLLAVPSFSDVCRSWLDSIIEMIVRECFWLIHF
ncbi:MAG: hypothetical protein GXO23_00220 [Crenarchaeota archaeon]|nr:hypothetical protein [Thermoproteota archaeon]